MQAADALNATSVVNTIALINGYINIEGTRYKAVEAIEFYKLFKTLIKIGQTCGFPILAKIVERNFKRSLSLP